LPSRSLLEIRRLRALNFFLSFLFGCRGDFEYRKRLANPTE
jgi:hypothetical protein